MTIDEAKDELKKFVRKKTTMKPAFVSVLCSDDVVETKRARWESVRDWEGEFFGVVCSNCRAEYGSGIRNIARYCPFCGAKMEEVQE